MQEVQNAVNIDLCIDLTSLADTRVTSSCFTVHDVYFDVTFSSDHSCDPPRRFLLEYSCESSHGYNGDEHNREMTVTFDRAHFVASAVKYLRHAIEQEKTASAKQDAPWTQTES